MHPSNNYGPVLAKVRVGKGKLLDKQKYNAILYSENFNTAISYLNSTDYWSYISKFAQTLPSTLEILNLLHDMELVSLLENLLCSKCYGMKIEDFQSAITREAFLKKVKVETLYENLAKILDCFLEKGLASELKTVLLKPVDDPNLHILEIRQKYWKILLETVKEKRGFQSHLAEIVRRQLLKENLLLILRLRRLGAPAKIIRKHLIPFSSTEEEVFEKILSTQDIKTLSSYIEELEGRERDFVEGITKYNIDELKTVYDRIIARQAYKVFLAYPFQPDIAYGYMILKRYEIEDVMNMLKAKILDIDIESLKKVLILPIFF
jgi:vacuolar-type H+-ATPase subunit C/Vma6